MQLTLAPFLTRADAEGDMGHLGIAVSGGSDSTALLLLAQDWAQDTGRKITALTVDHGLRDGAKAEAEVVAQLCARLGVDHHILTWDDWDGQGNLQDAARQARYGLLAQKAHGLGIDAVALGHTHDDQAETFLLRLARGSGVDGLSAMRADWRGQGMRWLRPVLTQRREGLRDLLRARHVAWCEDPSNFDPKFDRVQMRQAMGDLADLGLTADRLVTTATAMSEARAVLERAAHLAAKVLCHIEAGDVVIDPEGLMDLPLETRDRLVAGALGFVSGATYRPRRATLTRAIEEALDGQAATLHGCLLWRHKTGLRVTRELSAVAGLVAAPNALWDGRWRIKGADGPTTDGPTTDKTREIRALGEGISQLKDWRAGGIPRQTLMVTPAVWHQSCVIAAPIAQESDIWRLETRPEQNDFAASFLTH
ncbi:tRNA lysidine(34) synthetase TilS [Aliiroseovarius lamellibrachiae]|uniref:tRNA lysidine(34) synthetase TilS n=1 Tax=Aliiroseovarius lamellibrachiae TaxID=1924933 RepID=UPI0031B8ABF3